MTGTEVVVHDALTEYARKFNKRSVVLSVTQPQPLRAWILVDRPIGTGAAKVHHLPRRLTDAKHTIKILMGGD